MADGNRFYHPQPSFFDEFSKGVGLGLSMRQASDRAKQIELETQKQRMVMGELQRQRGVEDTMRTYAQGSPAQYAEDPGMTAEAQANPDFAGSGFTPLSVGQETAPARPQPTLREIMEFGVRSGASPQWIKSVGDALETMQGPASRNPTTLEGLAVERLLGGDKPGAEEALGMKVPSAAGEKVVSTNDVIAFVESGGAVRGPSIPPGFTVEMGKNYFQRQMDLASGRSGAQAEARRDVQLKTQGDDILTPSESGQLGVPYGTKRKEAMGKNAMTAQTRNTIQAMGSAEAVLSQIEDAALGKLGPDQKTRKGGAITAQSPLGRAVGAPGQFLGALSQSNPAAVRLQNLGKGLLAIFSRTVGGERGATTEQDVERAKELVPSIYDTTEIAKQKLDDMRTLINEIKSRAQAGASSLPGQSGGLPPPPKGWK